MKENINEKIKKGIAAITMLGLLTTGSLTGCNYEIDPRYEYASGTDLQPYPEGAPLYKEIDGVWHKLTDTSRGYIYISLDDLNEELPLEYKNNKINNESKNNKIEQSKDLTDKEQHISEDKKIDISNLKDISNISTLDSLVYKTNDGKSYTWDDIINQEYLSERDVYRLYKMAIAAKIAPVIGESAQHIIDSGIINTSVSLGNYDELNKPYIKIDDNVYYINPTDEDELNKACINYENADLAACGSYRPGSKEARINALKRFLSCDITKKGNTLNGSYNKEKTAINDIKNDKISQLKDLKNQALKAKIAMQNQNINTTKYTKNISRNMPRRG